MTTASTFSSMPFSSSIIWMIYCISLLSLCVLNVWIALSVCVERLVSPQLDVEVPRCVCMFTSYDDVTGLWIIMCVYWFSPPLFAHFLPAYTRGSFVLFSLFFRQLKGFWCAKATVETYHVGNWPDVYERTRYKWKIAFTQTKNMLNSLVCSILSLTHNQHVERVSISAESLREET